MLKMRANEDGIRLDQVQLSVASNKSATFCTKHMTTPAGEAGPPGPAGPSWSLWPARSRRQQLSCLPKFRQRSEEFLFWLPAGSSSAVQINWRAHVHSSLAAHQRRWQAVHTNQGTATMRYQVLTSLMIN